MTVPVPPTVAVWVTVVMTDPVYVRVYVTVGVGTLISIVIVFEVEPFGGRVDTSVVLPEYVIVV